MSELSKPSDAELKERLSPLEYDVTQKGGTEYAFSGCFWDHKAEGRYRCKVCGAALFASGQKYDSGSGWPSFWQPEGDAAIKEVKDVSHGMVRTEVRCGSCDSHLGHLFDDGPPPSGLRYCINSASLDFEAAGSAAPSEDPSN